MAGRGGDAGLTPDRTPCRRLHRGNDRSLRLRSPRPLDWNGTTFVMNAFAFFRQRIVAEIEALSAAGDLPAGLNTSRVTAEPPREASHGDIATNAAMVLAKPAGLAPRAIADKLAVRLANLAEVTGVEIAGPGFINLKIADGFWQARIADVIAAGRDYGASNMGAGKAVNVEYVSANPTGPLHIAHARGAVVGDALAALLAKTGYKVTRQYYINDAGAQVDTLARSTHLRYREALGETIEKIPEGFYPGEYLKEVGQALAARDGARWRDVPEQAWLAPVRSFAIERIMGWIREDLKVLGVVQEVFSSERAMVDSGGVDQALESLQARGLLYVGTLEPPKGNVPEDWEPRPQTLLRDGQQVKMSKRAGTFVTLREVVEEVGKDVVRFIMLTRKNDAPLDFDLAKVTEQSRDNPVFYVQYAHARSRSVLRNATAEFPGLESVTPGLHRLTDSGELALIKLMAGWPRVVESAAEAHEPHRIAFYLYDLAAAFHGLWK